jgi:hypothetical protein
MENTVSAPWSPEQVENITAFQNCEYVHQLFCPDHPDKPLRVCETHMFCAVPTECDYRQYWVPRCATEPLTGPTQTYLDAKEFCEGAFGPLCVDLAPYIKIVQNFLELQRNKTIDEVVEELRPWGAGMFTGWKGHTGESLITLDFAEEVFEDNFLDLIKAIRELKRE